MSTMSDLPTANREGTEFPAPGWATILLPYVASPATITFHASVLAVYIRVRWTCPPRLDAGLRSVSELVDSVVDHKGRTRSSYLSLAMLDGNVVAESELITVDDRPGQAPGPTPPRLPEIATLAGEEHRCGQFIVSEQQVHRYTRGYRGRFPTSSDYLAARLSGLVNTIVPGELIVEATRPHLTARSSGQIEAWFMRPVPAGAVVTLWAGDAPGVLALRLMSSPDPVAVLRSHRATPAQLGLDAHAWRFADA
jgi:hypothetical protein